MSLERNHALAITPSGKQQIHGENSLLIDVGKAPRSSQTLLFKR